MQVMSPVLQKIAYKFPLITYQRDARCLPIYVATGTKTTTTTI